MQEKSEYQKIRESILKQKEPFCLVDIVHRLENEKISENVNLIYNVLDELFQIKLVDYKFVKTTEHNPIGYAFVVEDK